MASSPDRREALLQYLPNLYTLAQAVSPDADAAAHLVEATYVHAFARLNEGEATPEGTEQSDKQWLFGVMMDVRKELLLQRRDADDEADVPLLGTPLHTLRRRLALDVVRRTFPAVLATLPGGLRVLLLLCEVEGLSCAEAAPILGLDADEACERLEQARTAARTSLRNEASARERHLLDASLPDDWLAAGLRHVLDTEFAAVPPTLQPAIAEAARGRLPAADDRTPITSETPTPDTVVSDGTSRLGRLLFALLLILTVGLIGYLATTILEGEPETNLVVLSAEQADAVRPVLTTDRPAEAERFVRERLDWRLTLPSIDQATLTGVGLIELTPEMQVPVFLYRDDLTGDPLTLYAYTYALLGRYQDQLHLAPDILRQIQDDRHFDLHDLGEQRVLVWRHRDDIFVAVTLGDAEALQERIVFPT